MIALIVWCGGELPQKVGRQIDRQVEREKAGKQHTHGYLPSPSSTPHYIIIMYILLLRLGNAYELVVVNEWSNNNNNLSVIIPLLLCILVTTTTTQNVRVQQPSIKNSSLVKRKETSHSFCGCGFLYYIVIIDRQIEIFMLVGNNTDVYYGTSGVSRLCHTCYY